MNANDDRIEPNFDAEPREEFSAAEDSPKLPKAEPLFGRIDAAPVEPLKAGKPEEERVEAPGRLPLMIWPKVEEPVEEPAPKTSARWPFRFDALGLAASVSAIGFVCVSLLAGYDHMRERALVAVKSSENQELVKSFSSLKTRIEAIETARSQEQTAELRKMVAEVKQAAQTAQGSGAVFGQLSQRVEKLEKDQTARLDKFGEKLEQAETNRYSELVARLDKIEKRPATVAVASPVPTPAPSPKTAASPTPVASASPGVSNDITGSIDKPKPVLRAYALDAVRGNVAYIESEAGPMVVGPGDTLPGAGRVLKIERRGGGWVVITSQGVIATP